MIEFPRPDGKAAPGYYAAPSGAANAPGVVMLEEWWGVTDHIKHTADKLAAAGFRVLVPDLYRGRVAAVGDEANHLMEGLDFGDAATQDARGAAQYLKATGSKKVGVIGFCMGGALTILAAMYDPEFNAAVTFYGYPPPEATSARSRSRYKGTGRYMTSTSPSRASMQSKRDSRKRASRTNSTATMRSTRSTIPTSPATPASGTTTRN